jgi:hypothetical protein
MKKQTYTIATLAVLVMLSVSVAKAQTANHRLIANIPFNFGAGDQSLTAGEYELKIVNPNSDQRVVKLTNLKDGRSVMLQTHGVSAKKIENARLVFHRYGSDYFLAQAWTGEEGMGMESAKSASEKVAMNRTYGNRTTETVAISRR